jgi:FMN-dependent NADH-azoreductase
MNILQIDSSALGINSATRELTRALARTAIENDLSAKLVHRDVDAIPIPHLSSHVLGGDDAAAAALGESVMQEFLDADLVIVGAPMYNFGVPSTLKAWIDRIAVAGRTFRYTAQGPVGLAGGKRVVIASARGGFYGENSHADFQEAYLRQLFGFLGIAHIEIVRAEGLAISPEQRSASLLDAHHEIYSRRELRVAA